MSDPTDIPPVTLVSPSGDAIAANPADVPSLLSRGYHVESGVEQAQRQNDAFRESEYGGVQGGIRAGLAGFARGASLGLTDTIGDGHELQELRDVNPGISTVTSIAGAVAPIALSGGAAAPEAAGEIGTSLLRATPTALVSNIGERVAGEGIGGAIGRGAIEGAAQNAGAYVSDVSLGDRQLSGEGFLSAMGQGALFGGGASGLVSAAERGLVAARNLFPKQLVTREAVEQAEQDAARSLTHHLEDGEILDQAATDRIRELRKVQGAADPALAARVDAAEAQATRAEMEAQAAKAEAAKLPPEPVDQETLLREQLAGTKGRLDRGESIAEIQGDTGAVRKPFSLANAPSEQPGYAAAAKAGEDAAHRELAAASDPWSEAQRLVKNLEDLRDSREAIRLATDGRVPGAATKGNVTAEEWDRITGGGPGLKVGPRATGENVLGGAAQIEKSIATHGEAPEIDLVKTAHALAQHEGASAELAQMLGPRAPSSALDHAAEFEQVAAKQAEKASAQAGIAAEHAENAAVAPEAVPEKSWIDFNREKRRQYIKEEGTDAAAMKRLQKEWQEYKAARDALKAPPGADPEAGTAAEPGASAAAKKPGLLQHLEHAGEILEALHTAGVPVPDPGQIPIVGPIAKLFLRAKILSKIFRRGPGQFLQTVDGAVAAKAASAQQKMYTALDHALDSTSKVLSKADAIAPAAAAVLGHKLFDDGYDRKPSKDLTENFRARAEELAAVTPKGIEDFINEKVPANDPELRAQIAQALTAQLSFLDGKLPKPDAVRSLFGGNPWQASKAEMETFAKYVNGATNPMDVITRACAGGQVSPQEVEAVQTVYPALFADAQKRLLSGAISNPDMKVSYARKVMIATVFKLPIVPAANPAYAQFLQSGYGAKPGAPSSTPPGAPTIKGPVNIGDRTGTRMDT